MTTMCTNKIKIFPYCYLRWKNHWKKQPKDQKTTKRSWETYFTRPNPITFNNSFSHFLTSHQKQLLNSGLIWTPNRSGISSQFLSFTEKYTEGFLQLKCSRKLFSFLQYFFSEHHKEVWELEVTTGLFSSINEMLNVPCCFSPYFACHQERRLSAASSRQLAFSAIQNCIIQANENPPKCNIVD